MEKFRNWNNEQQEQQQKYVQFDTSGVLIMKIISI